MVDLAAAFQHLKEKNVLVLGDFMCDLYTIGKANRISPEAPVVVLNVIEEKMLAGGAGNVVFNLHSLGAKVHPIGVLGDDSQGSALCDLFNQKGIATNGIFKSSKVQTIVKNRMIVDHQQLLRVDYEKKYFLDKDIELFIIDYIQSILKDFDVVAISDYQKGFLTSNILKSTIQKANSLNIPIVIDPKGKDFSKYQGATIIKPNSKEAYIAANIEEGFPIEIVADELLSKNYAKEWIITRSENGMSYFTKDKKQNFPVKVKEVVDVTGAGDTALAMITFCIANKLKTEEAISLANIASSIAIEKVGCAHVSLTEIADRLLEFDINDKFLSIDQIEIFKTIIASVPYVLFYFEKIDKFDFLNLENLKIKLKEYPESKKIVFIEEHGQSNLIAQILSSFLDLDFIITDKNFLEALMNISMPKKIEKISKYCSSVLYEEKVIKN